MYDRVVRGVCKTFCGQSGGKAGRRGLFYVMETTRTVLEYRYYPISPMPRKYQPSGGLEQTPDHRYCDVLRNMA